MSKNTQRRHSASRGGGLSPAPSACAASSCALRPIQSLSHQSSSWMAMAVHTPASPKAAAIGMQPVVSRPVDLVLGFLKHQFATPKDHRNWLYTPLRLHSPSLPPAQPGRALCVQQEFKSSPPGSPLSLKEGSKLAPVLAPFLTWALGLGVTAMGPTGPMGQCHPMGMQDSPMER